MKSDDVFLGNMMVGMFPWMYNVRAHSLGQLGVSLSCEDDFSLMIAQSKDKKELN